MPRHVHRLIRTALLALGAVAALALPAEAQQFRVPAATADAAYATGAARGASAGYRAGFNTGAFNSPYYATSPYGRVGGAYAGYLSGAADVISSQGQYAVDFQQGKLVKEQVNSAKTDNRRKQIDEWLYERAVLPTTEDERERTRMENLRRSRNDPPVTEIWSSKALNDLLSSLQKTAYRGPAGPDVPLDSDLIGHINVTSGATQGSLGLLKEGKLHWPLTLRKAAFTTDRQKLDGLCPQALKEAASGEVSAETLEAMIATHRNMTADLKGQIEVLTPNDYIKAKRYLTEIEDTIKALQDPEVGKSASRKWADSTASVGELVRQMTKQGLKFAPAVSGDQSSYVALHSAMVAYDGGASQMTATRP
jgi:hypothetical protein